MASPSADCDQAEQLWPMGDDCESRNQRLWHLMHVIVKEDAEELRDAITRGFDVNETYNNTAEKLVAFHTGKTSRQSRVYDDDRVQPLHLAACAGWEAGMRLLLEAGADVNARDCMMAAGRKKCALTPLMHVCTKRKVALVDTLLSYGADISICDFSNHHALGLALLHFSLPVLQTLLQNFPEKPTDPIPSSLLMYAVDMYVDPMLKISRARQDELKLSSEVKTTALKLMELCLRNGVDPNEQHPETQHGALHLCAKSCGDDLRGLELLVSYGADINHRTDTGEERILSVTPLCYACLYPNNASVIRWLIQHGARVNTTFHRAARGCTTAHPVCLWSHLLEMNLYENTSILLCAGLQIENHVPKLMREAAMTLQAEKAQLNAEDHHQLWSALTAEEELISNMINLVSEPRSLKWTCRTVLREHGGLTLPKNIQSLLLPQSLKDCLLCLDI